MICRISDERVSLGAFIDDWQDDMPLKSVEDISVYDLMGSDHDVYLSKNEDGTFNLQIDDENQELLAKETEIHPFAVESMADFCRRFLAHYDRVKG